MDAHFNMTKNHIQHHQIRNYYRKNAMFYDLSRWSFLFGRRSLILNIQEAKPQAKHILEVGCGTGTNISYLIKQYPKANITGLDVSADMLYHANMKHLHQKNIRFIQSSFLEANELSDTPWDIIYFSYSLSMINPQWKACIKRAKEILSLSGCIGVLDFHNSKYDLFKKLMSRNHVRMDGHLVEELKHNFWTFDKEIKSTHFGLWEYVLYTGYKV